MTEVTQNQENVVESAVEVDLDLEQESLAAVPGMEVTDEHVSYLGVKVPRGDGGPHTPTLSRFDSDVITDYDMRLMQKIALGLELNEAVLVEGGSGIGKTRTIERMCAQSNRECFYANCHDFDIDVLIGAKTAVNDPNSKSGFGWKDGIVLKAIREGGVLVLDEFNFMRDETRGRLHEILDAVMNGKDKISLLENDAEVVKVHPDFRLVAFTNPPGGEYEGRDTLDKAQLSRFIYITEPMDLPEEVKLARTMGAIGESVEHNITEGDYMHSGERIPRSQLSEIPGIKQVLRQYYDFHKTVEGLARKRALGEDQVQPLYFAYQRDFNRVLKFLSTHYRGDLQETMQQALNYLYVNKFRSETDRATVRELVDHIGRLPGEDSSRHSIDEIQPQRRRRQSRYS